VAEAAKLPPVFTAIVSDSGGDVEWPKPGRALPHAFGTSRRLTPDA